MIAAILLGAMLQAAPLRPEVWKERNQPDMPVLQACELGSDTMIANSLRQLPADVVIELSRFFDGSIFMSDAGGPFNSTDVVDGPVPQRRFLRAYQSGRYWLIWYEQGGRASGPRIIALYRDVARRNHPAAFRIAPGTLLAGNLCMAMKAILSGVRSASS